MLPTDAVLNKVREVSSRQWAALHLQRGVEYVTAVSYTHLIDGISEQTVWKFINHGFIREYADFYKLKN